VRGAAIEDMPSTIHRPRSPRVEPKVTLRRCWITSHTARGRVNRGQRCTANCVGDAGAGQRRRPTGPRAIHGIMESHCRTMQQQAMRQRTRPSAPMSCRTSSANERSSAPRGVRVVDDAEHRSPYVFQAA
jgi:hypothetical protein